MLQFNYASYPRAFPELGISKNMTIHLNGFVIPAS